MRYKVRVYFSVSKIFTVEADDPKEAESMAQDMGVEDTDLSEENGWSAGYPHSDEPEEVLDGQ